MTVLYDEAAVDDILKIYGVVSWHYAVPCVDCFFASDNADSNNICILSSAITLYPFMMIVREMST